MKLTAFVLLVLCVIYAQHSCATRWTLPHSVQQRITRQVGTGRFDVLAGPNYGGGGVGGGGGGIPNGYRPLSVYNSNVRSGITQSVVGAKRGNIPNQHARKPEHVGDTIIGGIGMASGRPAFGSYFGLDSAVGRPQTRPLQNRVYSYNGGAVAAAAATSGGSRPTAFRYH